MIKKLFVLLAIVVMPAAIVHAHNGRITGTVTAISSESPIPFASIRVDGSNLGTMADSSGHFIFDHIPVGRQTIIVSAVGYHARRLTVTIGEEQTAELNVAMQPNHIDVGGIVVTGTRTPRYIKDVPVFTEVVSKASIEDKSANNIFEALDGESGVRVEQQCQACNFTILRMQGLGADHTQILLDGQPMYSGLAAVYGLQQMSTADVDQVEIVKGAGSALYGSNAVAGAINIVSSIPRKTEGKVNIEIGEYGTNSYSLSAGSRRDNLALFVFAQQTEQDELDATGDSDAPGGVDNPDGWIDRVRSSATNAGFNLFIDNLLVKDRLVIRGRLMDETRLGGWLTDNLFENPFATGTERVVTDRFSGQLEYQVSLSNGTEINTNVSVTEHKRDATNDTFLGDYQEAYGEMPPVDLLRPYLAEENLFLLNLNVVKPLAGGHRLLAGTQFSRNALEESGLYLDIDTQEPYSSLSKKSAYEIGTFVQDEFVLSDKIEVVAGLRFDYHNSEDEFRGSGDVLPQGLEPLEYNESTLNPRFSIKYAVSEAVTLRGSIGSGFRVPYGFSEDLHLCSGSPRVYKGGGLKPEKSLSYSLTADYTGSSATISINGYLTKLTDAIAFAEADPDVAELGYTYQWINVDDAYVTGLELNGSVSIANGLILGARCEFFDGKYDHARADWVGTEYEDISRNISRFPNFSGGLKLAWTFENWNLVADADYKGKMYIDLTEPADPAGRKIHETESYVILNAKISRTFLGRYKTYFGAKNLTDYTQKEKHIDDAAFMYAPMYGRLLYGGIQISL